LNAATHVWTRTSLSAHAISTPDVPHPLGLLRTRRERPRCRAADERDEFAPFHCQCFPCFRPKG